MKSILSGVDLSPPRLVYIPEEGHQSFVPLFYADNLRAALESALRLCEAYRLKHDEAVRNYWQENRTKELETALEPFRKEQK